jgi:chromosomal replication initiation ATPase DnaA
MDLRHVLPALMPSDPPDDDIRIYLVRKYSMNQRTFMSDDATKLIARTSYDNQSLKGVVGYIIAMARKADHDLTADFVRTILDRL